MNRAVWRGSSGLLRCAERLSSTRVPAVAEKPVFDKAWDKGDYRLQRFDIAGKQVNPNVAQQLVAERPPEDHHEHVVACDGGHPALGHPKVYINLDKPGVHVCGYCGNRFFNSHVTGPEDMDKQHVGT